MKTFSIPDVIETVNKVCTGHLITEIELSRPVFEITPGEHGFRKFKPKGPTYIKITVEE